MFSHPLTFLTFSIFVYSPSDSMVVSVIFSVNRCLLFFDVEL